MRPLVHYGGALTDRGSGRHEPRRPRRSLLRPGRRTRDARACGTAASATYDGLAPGPPRLRRRNTAVGRRDHAARCRGRAGRSRAGRGRALGPRAACQCALCRAGRVAVLRVQVEPAVPDLRAARALAPRPMALLAPEIIAIFPRTPVSIRTPPPDCCP